MNTDGYSRADPSKRSRSEAVALVAAPSVPHASPPSFVTSATISSTTRRVKNVDTARRNVLAALPADCPERFESTAPVDAIQADSLATGLRFHCCCSDSERCRVLMKSKDSFVKHSNSHLHKSGPQSATASCATLCERCGAILRVSQGLPFV